MIEQQPPCLLRAIQCANVLLAIDTSRRLIDRFPTVKPKTKEHDELFEAVAERMDFIQSLLPADIFNRFYYFESVETLEPDIVSYFAA